MKEYPLDDVISEFNTQHEQEGASRNLTTFLSWLIVEGYISDYDWRENSIKHEELIEKDQCSACKTFMDVDDKRERCPRCGLIFGEPVVRNRMYVRKE